MEKDELIASLKTLCQIQQLDLDLKNLQSELDDIPIQISRWKDELETHKTEITENKKEIEKLNREVKEKEIELNGNQETLKKYNAQLYIVKTNKEYSSLLHEIEEIKRKDSHIEDNMLELMEAIDSKEKEGKNKKQKLEQLEQELKQKEQKAREKEKQLNENVAQRKNEREKVTENADQSLLAKYQRISESKDGLAVVAITGKSCGGCHLQVTPQKLNEIKFGSKMITCEGCGRILYCEESLK